MGLLSRGAVLASLVALVYYGNACNPSLDASNGPPGNLSSLSCLSDESTLAHLSPAELKTGYVGQHKVVYRRFNDRYILVDGDKLILSPNDLPEAPVPAGVSQGVGVLPAAGRTWPGGIIPYEVSPNLPNPQIVVDAVNHWNTNLQGVITLRPHSTETDYASFVPVASGCYSIVGYTAGLGAHFVNLSTDCGSGNVAHEIGHIVGLDHEQNRLDRDSVVSINWPSVMAGFEQDFQINTTEQDYQAYDFGSIMHYSLYAFSADGSPTISPRPGVVIPPTVFVGQRAGLSIGDINSVRNLYGFGAIANAAGVTGANLTVQNGLLARYFDTLDYSNLVFQRIEQNLNDTWQSSPPVPMVTMGTFAIRWTGYVVPPQDGNYTFVLDAMDSAKVRLTNTVILSLTGDNSPKEAVSSPYAMTTTQRYPIVIDYWKNLPGSAGFKLSWQRPDGITEVIPPAQLMPDPNDSVRPPCQSRW
ncbi:MAG: hypothetical protein C5B49_07785 [Bdellovibrio sp.]|nr:MAG: hypothetical protein C5B49_07785 [Bdellovibrio sp.]